MYSHQRPQSVPCKTKKVKADSWTEWSESQGKEWSKRKQWWSYTMPFLCWTRLWHLANVYKLSKAYPPSSVIDHAYVYTLLTWRLLLRKCAYVHCTVNLTLMLMFIVVYCQLSKVYDYKLKACFLVNAKRTWGGPNHQNNALDHPFECSAAVLDSKP